MTVQRLRRSAAYRLLALLSLCWLLHGAAVAAAEAPPRTAREARLGSDSGLPLPRFVSLRSDKINVRAGPGTRYPVAWQFLRRGLPVEVLAEFEYWRKIRDHDGAEGWVHRSLLSSRRTALVLGDVRPVLAAPDTAAAMVARTEPGVQVRLLSCQQAWCRVEVGDRRGHIQRRYLWGVYPNETID